MVAAYPSSSRRIGSVFGKFGLRHMRERKGRTLATIAGIALGVTMIAATTAVNSSTQTAFADMIAAFAGRAQLQVLPVTKTGFDQSRLADIQSVPGVRGVFPTVSGATRVVKGSRDVDTVIAYGIDPGKDSMVREWVPARGRLLSGAPHEVILPYAWAHAHGFAPGSTLTLVAADGREDFTVVGLVADKGPGVLNGGKLVVTSLADAQRVFGRASKVDQADLVLMPGADSGHVKEALQAKLGPAFSVEFPFYRNADVEETLSGFNTVLGFAGAASLLVGVFLVYNNMEINAEERRFTVAMLRAFGLRRNAILRLLLSEALLMGIVGSALGVAAGLWLARLMAGMLAQTLGMIGGLTSSSMSLSAASAMLCVLAGVATTLVAALIPALRITQVTPLEALRPVETAWGERGRLGHAGSVAMTVCGGCFLLLVGFFPTLLPDLGMSRSAYEAVALVAAGMLVLGLVLLLPTVLGPLAARVRGRRVEFRMAMRNLTRAPGRTTATVGGLMVALVMMVMVAGTATSYEAYTRKWLDTTSSRWSVLVLSKYQGTGLDVPLDASFGHRLEAMSGVQMARGLTVTPTTFHGQSLSIYAYDMNAVTDFFTLDVIEGDAKTISAKLKTGRWVALSTVAARKTHLRLGDTITLQSPSGPVSLGIAALVNDPGSTVHLDRSVFQTAWRDSRIDGFGVLLKKGSDPDRFVADVRREFASSRLTTRTRAELTAQVMQLTAQTFDLPKLLLYLALFVAAAGIMNAAVISVWQRKRELATLRAVGARSSQVRLLVLLESVAMGAMGALLGTAVGAFVSWVMVESNRGTTGQVIQFLMPWGTVATMLVIAVCLAALASLIPSSAATRVDIVEGLGYE